MQTKLALLCMRPYCAKSPTTNPALTLTVVQYKKLITGSPDMSLNLISRIENTINKWLLKEEPTPDIPLSNFDALASEMKLADVILVEGRSRISQVIKLITQSQWSHSALYVGSLSELKDENLRQLLTNHGVKDDNEKYVVESLLGKGMVLTPLYSYAKDNIRVCRPRGLTVDDANLVVKHNLEQLGREYDMRQLFDLARFLFPYRILPRRWHSSLFSYNAGKTTRIVCSTAVAEAFMNVNFPVLPIVKINKNGGIRLRKRNPRIFLPKDFDSSPYFDIIKHPFIEFPETKFSFLHLHSVGAYHNLPWDKRENIVCNSADECFEIIVVENTD
jgi:hypothetical protein